LIAQLHQHSPRTAYVLTGGGNGLAGWLLSVPGGSRSVLEVSIPYDESALAEYLGAAPASYCSADTAKRLAARALERARRLAPGQPVAGFACTASLRSDRPKRGEHRFHGAIDNGMSITTRSLVLARDARPRHGEEEVLDRVMLNLLAESAGVGQRVDVPLLEGEVVQEEVIPLDDPIGLLFSGRSDFACVEPDGRIRTVPPLPRLLLAGSFNPLHHGHVRLAETAGRMLGLAPALELAVHNADKPSLGVEEVRLRSAQAAWRYPLWLTSAPTFVQKARLFPGVVFVVGHDTAERLIQPRFYGDDPSTMLAALDEIREKGCRFLVAGRAGPSGEFCSVEQLPTPPSHRDLFSAIPECAFREDVSSTAIRAIRVTS
jgi:hypothetical protein